MYFSIAVPRQSQLWDMGLLSESLSLLSENTGWVLGRQRGSKSLGRHSPRPIQPSYQGTEKCEKYKVASQCVTSRHYLCPSTAPVLFHLDWLQIYKWSHSYLLQWLAPFSQSSHSHLYPSYSSRKEKISLKGRQIKAK